MFQLRSNMLRSIFVRDGAENAVSLRYFGGLHSACQHTDLSCTNFRSQPAPPTFMEKADRQKCQMGWIQSGRGSSGEHVHQRDVCIPMVVLALPLW